MKFITRETFGPVKDWVYFLDAIDAGHALPKAQVEDVFLGSQDKILLSRAARIESIGFGVKSVTVMADNTACGLPGAQGGIIIFDEETDTPTALIDGALITDIKTAADSALGARYLARRDVRNMVLVGVSNVARNNIAAYSQIFPSLDCFALWNRTYAKAEALSSELSETGIEVKASKDLAHAVAEDDIVSCATMSLDPILEGKWLQPGTHVDLIGAFRADMREADDYVLTRGEIYFDSRDTTIAHIGELRIPPAEGVISESDIIADLDQLNTAKAVARLQDTITVFKNGRGAHLDLMIANAILKTEKT